MKVKILIPTIWVHLRTRDNLKWKSLSRVQLFGTPWSVTHQVPLSMEFSRQEYWSGLLFPYPGESSWPRDWTLLSCIVGRLFIIWATRERPATWKILDPPLNLISSSFCIFVGYYFDFWLNFVSNRVVGKLRARAVDQHTWLWISVLKHMCVFLVCTVWKIILFSFTREGNKWI